MTATLTLTASQVTSAIDSIRKAYAKFRHFDTHPAYRNQAARERDIAQLNCTVNDNDRLLIHGGYKALVGHLVAEHTLQTRINEAKRGLPANPGVPARPELQSRLRGERAAIRKIQRELPNDNADLDTSLDWDDDVTSDPSYNNPTLTVTPEAAAIIDGWADELAQPGDPCVCGDLDHATEDHDREPVREDGTACVLFFTAYLKTADVDRFKRYIYDSHTLVAEIELGTDSYGQVLSALVYKTVGRDHDQTSYLQQYQADRLASGLLGAVICHVSYDKAAEYVTNEFTNNGGSGQDALATLGKAETMARVTGSVSGSYEDYGIKATWHRS